MKTLANSYKLISCTLVLLTLAIDIRPSLSQDSILPSRINEINSSIYYRNKPDVAPVNSPPSHLIDWQSTEINGRIYYPGKSNKLGLPAESSCSQVTVTLMQKNVTGYPYQSIGSVQAIGNIYKGGICTYIFKRIVTDSTKMYQIFAEQKYTNSSSVLGWSSTFKGRALLQPQNITLQYYGKF